MDLGETFYKFDDDYLKFDKVRTKFSNRPDLCAFILLEKMIPGNSDIISASEHDEFYLDIDCAELANIATEDDIHDLVCCGVRYDAELDSLAMFS